MHKTWDSNPVNHSHSHFRGIRKPLFILNVLGEQRLPQQYCVEKAVS